MIRKFGMNFIDEEELECYYIDLALQRQAQREGNPRPQYYPRHENEKLNKNFITSEHAIKR